jgi:predicted Ser/Thr protein kinase
MTETQDEALKDTEAAPAALLELGLTADMPDAEAIARALPQYDGFVPIGQGGMGVVWKARQVQLDRPVAIKLLRPELAADPSFAERFAREARALAKLQHPGIVGVHDYGEVLGLYYLVMEYVEGTDLRTLLERGVDAEQALAIVPQLCDALQYAHEEGVVHRDIKPENILVDRRGRVRIADFGLAKLRSSGTSVRATSSGRVLGTPHYMAPEQIDRPGEVDHRADIFALGVVIYEMLTGKLPIGRFEPPSRVRKVDVRLDDVVLRSLEHDRERRFQHASEVKARVVALGPAPDQVRSTADEVQQRVDAERKQAMRGAWWGIPALIIVWTLVDGCWFETIDGHTTFHFGGASRFGKWSILGVFVLSWLVGFVTTAFGAWRLRGTSRGAVLRCKTGVGAMAMIVALGIWVAVRGSNMPAPTGNPLVGVLFLFFVAVMVGYFVWTYAVEQRVPARIVFGPQWWIPRWEAELEPRVK